MAERPQLDVHDEDVSEPLEVPMQGPPTSFGVYVVSLYGIRSPGVPGTPKSSSFSRQMALLIRGAKRKRRTIRELY